MNNDQETQIRQVSVVFPQEKSEDWEATVTKALVDYRYGRALMDQLAADRLLDAPTAGMLLAIRLPRA